jgi:hypothetical protein
MAYIGNAPVLQSTEFREEFFPTSNQSAFTTGGFHPSAVSVTRNGVLLSESDYVKGSDNVTITLNSAAISGDVVVIRGNRSLAQGIQVTEQTHEQVLSASDSKTAVAVNFDLVSEYTQVLVNGVRLWYGDGSADGTNSDWSVNVSTRTVTFASALSTGDLVVIESREPSASDPIDRVVHYNSISENMTIPSSQNVAFFGDTTFSGTITNNGYFTVAHGVANFTGTVNSTGTINIV